MAIKEPMFTGPNLRNSSFEIIQPATILLPALKQFRFEFLRLGNSMNKARKENDDKQLKLNTIGETLKREVIKIRKYC